MNITLFLYFLPLDEDRPLLLPHTEHDRNGFTRLSVGKFVGVLAIT